MSLPFQFADFQAFIAMGGHGIYVWLCYGIVITGLTRPCYCTGN